MGLISPKKERINMDTNPVYEFEVFLSTDGKHTVHGKVSREEDIIAMITKVGSVYDTLVTKYGLKPISSFGSAPKPPKVSAGSCAVHQQPMVLNKNGKPYHRDSERPFGQQFCNGRGFPDELEMTR